MNIGQANKLDPIFSNNNTLMRLLYINLAVFLGLILLYLPFWLMQSEVNPKLWATDWFAVPSNLSKLILRPWTIISYMFLHRDFWHLFTNMLWLYFLGQLFVQFLGERKLLTVYLAGGIAGALLYIVSFNVFPVFSEVSQVAMALGASASVMAIVVALATHAPDYSIRLFLIGNVKLKYIALLIFILDLAGISNSNSGGHIAHLGGAILGFVSARQWKKGVDITAWAGHGLDVIQSLLGPKKPSNLKVKFSRKSANKTESSRAKEDQAAVDRILDKISKSGYESLSKSEKETLFRAGKK